MTHYHFIGIQGLGMKPLALYLNAQGHRITGSDRSYDTGTRSEDPALLEKNISCSPQNGSGIDDTTEAVVCSSAIEYDNPDILAAQKRHIPILMRSQVLSELINQFSGITIAGTSGKTTSSAMCAYVLGKAGIDLSFIIGGALMAPSEKRAIDWRYGKGPHFLIEADESDGSLVSYHPNTAVLLNISDDHKTLDELMRIFQSYLNQAKERIIINTDCTNCQELNLPKIPVSTFGIHQTADYQAVNIAIQRGSCTFQVNKQDYVLQMPGTHNIYNALACIALMSEMKIAPPDIARILSTFLGVKRRLEKIGEANAITVYDDYAHNPMKISSAIHALAAFSKRLRLIYQPHGFGPLRMQFDRLLETFTRSMRSCDLLYLLPVYDAGGTADRSIGSDQLAEALRNHHVNATAVESREALKSILMKEILPGDIILVMGARDHSLGTFSREIFEMIPAIPGFEKNI
ncbi:MAG: Mur ligase domain-containing protein [Chlamydiota bacterium]|nr:Mur ligase domain-containing protein [Chlamydiota bacterium]